MSGDILYAVLRYFGYTDRQKEIDRVRAGLATTAEKHALIDEIRIKRSLTSAPKRRDFANDSDYDAAKAKYVALKDQLREIGYNYNNDSETSELERLTKKIRSELKSEIVKKPVEPVKPTAIANPNLNKDKFCPEDFPRNAGSQ